MTIAIHHQAKRAGFESFDQLIERARTGDDDALGGLYRDHVAMVLGYLSANGANDPEDLTAEVFVGMLRGLAKFDGDHAEFRRWLMTITHRRLIDQRRRKTVILGELAESPGSRPAWGNSVGDDFRAAELDLDLVRAFELLTDAQREILGLRFIADMSLRDVAAITGRPTGAVKSLQNRALEALRKTLGTEPHQPAGSNP